MQRSLTRFGLMRHARTEWNLEKRIQGRQDTPITPEGEAQARRWGKLLKPHSWNQILTSDSGRALKTAEIINAALDIPIQPEQRLREQDWGIWTGKTTTQIRQETSLLAEQEVKGWEFCPPGGELLEAVWQRSSQALLEAAQKWPGMQILVITHEGVIRSLIYRFNSRQYLLNKPLRIQPWHLHLLVCDRKELRIDKVNALKLD